VIRPALVADPGQDSANEVRLDADTIEAIARHVVEILDGRSSSQAELGRRLIDAAEVGRRLGLTRSTVYEKANTLGVIRLGSGPRARLRFDPDVVERVAKAAVPRRAPEPNGLRVAPGGRRPAARGELLPIRRMPGR
jgi:hypothetical protein